MSRTAIVTVSIGPSKLITASQPVMEHYAARISATFIKHTDCDSIRAYWLRVLARLARIRGVKQSQYYSGMLRSYVLMQKLVAVYRCLEHFDRVIFLDADTIVSPTCPSLFDIVPTGWLGAMDEAVHLGKGQEFFQGLLRSACNEYGQCQPVKCKNVQWINSGVMVVDKKHRHLFLPPKQLAPEDVYGDQSYLNVQLMTSCTRVFALDLSYNYLGSLINLTPLSEILAGCNIVHVTGGYDGDRPKFMQNLVANWYEASQLASR